ncbi:thiamine pyrophosphate-binding protein [Bacteroides bouchesdurhonensis]|uniref:thiamine pyrophosphate-binding protein n=1 Tax=Bacteroides bouchesdurhonensis TaxID=1841855 RepID=UPI0011DD804A|nr:thiamine pyrophosphate-binding protein [Bacteroides bouchesdurhonensis]
MKRYNTVERNAQIVLFLLKAKGIKKIVASPGTTNIALVGSMQNDEYFEMYSAPDERSAAYMACGLSVESGEPVVLTCTGATASRNYLPGLTEAYYRKIPVIALTSTQNNCRSGHLYPQFIDRTEHPIDTVKKSYQIPVISKPEDEWECEIKINDALLECRRDGGGPVHINITTGGEYVDFSVKEIKPCRNIVRHTYDEIMPSLENKKVAIFIGSHKPFSLEETKAIDSFCEQYNSVVFCDQTSGYKGEYRVLYPLVARQNIADSNLKIDVLIHLGEVSGDYYTTGKFINGPNVWRVSPDGELRDYFHTLSDVFEMSEFYFFKIYSEKTKEETVHKEYLNKCLTKRAEVLSLIGELPFSNVWIANQITNKVPDNSTVHVGILNSLRCWNFFEVSNTVNVFSNVGGFGIDGGVSTLIGASLVNPNKLYFGIFGDLAFFYDMNSLGNRHVGSNVRILLVNNGKGTEFRNYVHPGSKFGEEADLFIAAGGHYGNKSHDLVRHYSKDLGFLYLSASNKNEFSNVVGKFLSVENISQPILLEVFTSNEDESNALKIINELQKDFSTKETIMNLIGEKCINMVRKIIK